MPRVPSRQRACAPIALPQTAVARAVVAAIVGGLSATGTWAQTVIGPGAVAPPVSVNNGSLDNTVVGNTSISTAATGSATSITNGALTLDPGDTRFPAGPITINSQNGHGLFANSSGGASTLITARPGVAVTIAARGTGAVALGAGARIDASGLAIATTFTGGAGGGYGAVAQSGGVLALSGSSVSVANTRGIALGSSGAGSALSMLGSQGIATSGAFATGLYVHNTGSLQLSADTLLQIQGQGSTGLVLDGAAQPDGAIGARLTVRLDGSATTAVNGSTGVALFGGSTVRLQGLVVEGADAGTGVVAVAGDPRTSSALGAASAHATLEGASITINRAGGSAYTLSSSATGALVTTAGNTTPVMGTVVSSAPAGLRATPGFNVSPAATSTIHASDTTITVNADQGFGVYAGARLASGLNTVNLVDSTVRVGGARSYGLGADQNGRVTATRSNVTATGSDGGGLYLITGTDVAGGQGPEILLSDSQVLAQGSAAGMVSLNYSNTLVNRVSMAGGALGAPDSVALYATGGPTEVLVDRAGVSGGGLLLQALGSATAPQPTVLQLRASNGSALAGDAYADPAAVASIELRTASRWSGAAIPITTVSVDPSSAWSVTGNSVLTQAVTNAGLVAFTPPLGAFKTLRTRDYVGAGGILGVNTFLGGDGSPSDRLVIDGGAASGVSAIRVTNAGGQGARTLGNGIMVVDAVNGGTTQPGMFALGGRVVAGVYEYRLWRGSTDGSNGEAWYLRSSAAAPAPPQPPAPAPVPAPEPAPLYRPEVGAYLANQRFAAGFLLHSLHDRLGEPQWTEQQTFENDNERRKSFWLRVVGRDVRSHTRNGLFSADGRTWLLQGGGELARWSVFGADDRLHLGGMLGYGWGSSTAHAQSNEFRADGDTRGLSVGAYATWYQNDEHRLGWYADFWAQYGWFRNTVDGQSLPPVAYDSRMFAVSAETGYAWLPGRQRDWVVEPQAQVIWLGGRQDGVTEANGTRIDQVNGQGWIGRLGVRAHRTWLHDGGDRTQLFLTANWWHDGMGNGQSFNTVGMRDLYPQERYELKLGVHHMRHDGWSGWANVGWETGRQSFRAVTARVGVKYTW